MFIYCYLLIIHILLSDKRGDEDPIRVIGAFDHTPNSTPSKSQKKDIWCHSKGPRFLVETLEGNMAVLHWPRCLELLQYLNLLKTTTFSMEISAVTTVCEFFRSLRLPVMCEQNAIDHIRHILSINGYDVSVTRIDPTSNHSSTPLQVRKCTFRVSVQGMSDDKTNSEAEIEV
jgi:hypothetical protein